jgi:flavin reductase (DIM6/NTAB) family NADH-FMN oxidoreductase RutF
LSNQDNIAVFKEIMGSYPTGVTIVTSTDRDGNPVGLTVNSFASVSLDPLLVLWSIDHRVTTLDAFKQAEGFAVHVLAADQKELCWAFAGKEPDRFAKAQWSMSEHKLPVIDGAFGVLQCKTIQKVEAGDHTIMIGEVIDISKFDKDPMLYFRRNVGPVPTSFGQ